MMRGDVNAGSALIAWAFGWLFLAVIALRFRLIKRGATGIWWWTKSGVNLTVRDIAPAALCMLLAVPALVILVLRAGR